jgi:hypothetical protein
MPRGEKQNKNLKYHYDTQSISLLIDDKDRKDFYINRDYNSRIDTKTIKTERGGWRDGRYDQYGLGTKKKVYTYESGLKYPFTVFFPVGIHQLWTSHYFEVAKLSKEIDYLNHDIKEKERKIKSWNNWWKIVKVIQNLKTENEDKIKSLCKERDNQELVYEKIISYEIPVRHRVFRSPYNLETDKYGVGPFNTSYEDEQFHRLEPEGERYSRDASEKSIGRLYSMNPQESIENIRNDEERIERLEKFRYEIHDHQGRVNQLKGAIGCGGYYDNNHIVNYDKIETLSYFEDNTKVSIEFNDDEYEISCAKSLILNAKVEHNKHTVELNRLMALRETKEERLTHIRSSKHLDSLCNKVDKILIRRKAIESLQIKRNRIKDRWVREEAERQRKEDARIAEGKRQAKIAKKRADHKVWRKEKLPTLKANLCNHTCGCTSRKGTIKKWYATKPDAFAAAADRMTRNEKLDLAVYACPAQFEGPYYSVDCGGFHLTSTKNY